MGKKTKKTKWRTLEIPSPGKNYENIDGKWDVGRRTSSANYQRCDKFIKGHDVTSSVVPSASLKYSASNEAVKTLIEDEYTKITTPRQDVLFKKGYLTKRKTTENAASENTTTENIITDGIVQQDCATNEEFSNYANGGDNLSQLVCPTPQPYVDSSALFYGGGYEIYDPYTGSVTAVVVSETASQYAANIAACQPILTSMPCRPVPLQPVQWFNPVPSSDWCCSYAQPNEDGAAKKFSTDSQNGSGVGSESSCAPESPTSLIDDQANNCAALYPPSYVYPGYMFGAPVYNVDGINVQYCSPESPILSSSESTTSKKKKKKKRRRHIGETEEGSESSADENCNGSVSHNEYMLDDESIEFDNDVVENGKRFNLDIRNGCVDSLPHANVNAAPFVPATRSFPEFSAIEISVGESSVDSKTLFNIATVGGSDNSNVSYDGKNYSISTSNVYCKPYDSDQNQRKINHGSSSNNSDSGISSPGSEDNSQTDKPFQKPVKGGKPKTVTSNAILVENVTITTNSTTVNTLISSVANVLINQNETECDKNISSDIVEINDNYDENLKVDGKINDSLEAGKLIKKTRSKKPSKTVHNSTDCHLEQKSISAEGEKILGKNCAKIDSIAISNTRKKHKSNKKHSSSVASKQSTMVNQRETNVVKSNAADVENELENRSKTDAEFCPNTLENEISKKVVASRSDDRMRQDWNSSVQVTFSDQSNNFASTLESRACASAENSFESSSLEHARQNTCIGDDSIIGNIGVFSENKKEHTTNRIHESNEHSTRSRCECDENSGITDDTKTDDQIIRAIEKPLSAELVDIDADASDERPIVNQLVCSNFASCRETTRSDSLRTREMIEATAQSVVNEIIKHAEARVHSSSKCDILQLPITQAVTNWLNARGGFPTVETESDRAPCTNYDISSSASDSEGNEHQIITPNGKQSNSSTDKKLIKSNRVIKSSKSKTSCVIC